jgi:hypothetical protein
MEPRSKRTHRFYRVSLELAYETESSESKKSSTEWLSDRVNESIGLLAANDIPVTAVSILSGAKRSELDWFHFAELLR